MAPRQRVLAQSSTYDESSESSVSLSEDKKGISRKLETLNQTEADIARDWHDYFNLIALVRIYKSISLGQCIG